MQKQAGSDSEPEVVEVQDRDEEQEQYEEADDEQEAAEEEEETPGEEDEEDDERETLISTEDEFDEPNRLPPNSADDEPVASPTIRERASTDHDLDMAKGLPSSSSDKPQETTTIAGTEAEHPAEAEAAEPVCGVATAASPTTAAIVSTDVDMAKEVHSNQQQQASQDSNATATATMAEAERQAESTGQPMPAATRATASTEEQAAKKRKTSKTIMEQGPVVKVHQSPVDILNQLCPRPYCSLLLNKNDHRWTSTWKKDIPGSDRWIDELGNLTFSRRFDSKSEDSWKSALLEVHDRIWTKWSLNFENLPIEMSAQDPGVISDAIFEQLAEVIATLPPQKVYDR